MPGVEVRAGEAGVSPALSRSREWPFGHESEYLRHSSPDRLSRTAVAGEIVSHAGVATRKDAARMPSRSVRSAAALALATSVTSFAYVGSVAPAQAAGYNGYCKTSFGVTVVVDFRNLGGGVAIRCSPVGGGATGQQALEAAGIPVTEPARMPGFVCRLYGEPTATATLPGGYHEQCVNTPPSDAHWQYYQASNGGSWGSSSRGYTQSQVIAGGFEGWSFTEGSTDHAPAVAPSRPSAPPPPPKTQPPAPPRHSTPPRQPTTTAPSKPKSTASPTHSKAAGSAASSHVKSTTASKVARKKTASTATHSSSPTTKHSTAPSSSSAAGVTGTSPGAPTNDAGAAAANSDELIKNSNKPSSVNATTVVGGGVLGALAIGGGVVAIIRRRHLG